MSENKTIKNRIFDFINKKIEFSGYKIQRTDQIYTYHNLDPDFVKMYESTNWSDYTMTQIHNLHALHQSVSYVIEKQVPGDFVECGVWRGGSMMYVVEMLKKYRVTDRDIWLYDTFNGMTEPTLHDKKQGKKDAHEIWKNTLQNGHSSWCYASLEDVKENLLSTGYPENKIHFVKGDVLETLKKKTPEKICLLRLDTDWYESTKFELEELYPKISPNGVLLIDDYGTWSGSKKACDEYFAQKTILLHRVDQTARIAVKP